MYIIFITFAILMVLVFLIYFIPSGKFFSSPVLILLLGMFTVLLASGISSTIDIFALIPEYKHLSSLFKTGADLVSMSLAALGGGILSTAFVQRSKLVHIEELEDLKKTLQSKKEKLQQYKDIVDGLKSKNPHSDEDQKAITRVILNIVDLEIDIEERQNKIISRSRAN